MKNGQTVAWCDWKGTRNSNDGDGDGDGSRRDDLEEEKSLPPAVLCTQNCPPGYEDTPDCDVKLPGTYCPNQCNGRGACSGGFCHCDQPWWGADCSLSRIFTRSLPGTPAPVEDDEVSSSSSSSSSSPSSAAEGAVEGAVQKDVERMEVKRRRARPLIYVYEIPSDYNSGIHQRRFKDYECVPRTYERGGDTVRQAGSTWYYSLETTFHEYLMRSAHRTTDPAEADFFYVPVYSTCFHLRYNKPMPRHWAWNLPSPNIRPHGTWRFWTKLANYVAQRLTHPDMVEARRGRVAAAAAAAKAAAEAGTHLVTDGGSSREPNPNQDDLSDHIFITPYDEGACYLPRELGDAVFITHWGNTGSGHHGSTTGFGNDNWDKLASPNSAIGNVLGGWRCYDPAKDIVVPPWNRMKRGADHAAPAKWPRGLRPNLFFFAGDLGTAEGIPESGPHKNPRYSMGIRQRVTKKLRDRRDEGFFIAGNIPDYVQQVQASTFCGVFPGGVVQLLNFIHPTPPPTAFQ